MIFLYWTLFSLAMQWLLKISKKSVILPFFFFLLLTVISWREQNFCSNSSVSSEEQMGTCSTERKSRSSFWEGTVSWVLVLLGAQEMSSRAGLIWKKTFYLLFSLFNNFFFGWGGLLVKQAQDSLQMQALEIVLHRISQTDGEDIHWALNYLFLSVVEE